MFYILKWAHVFNRILRKPLNMWKTEKYNVSYNYYYNDILMDYEHLNELDNKRISFMIESNNLKEIY